MKRVSIIIPVYNVEAYIEDCIASVMAQDYEQLEVLIVDDCTPDESISIVEKMISGYEDPIFIGLSGTQKMEDYLQLVIAGYMKRQAN